MYPEAKSVNVLHWQKWILQAVSANIFVLSLHTIESRPTFAGKPPGTSFADIFFRQISTPVQDKACLPHPEI